MFSRIAKEDFSPARLRMALPYFLLFWLGGSSIFLSFPVVVRQHLHAQEMAETESLMHTFLRENTLSAIYRDSARLQGGHQLGGLVFIRLIHGNDHLIRIQESHRQGLDFNDIVDLGPDKSGVWLRLGKGERPGVMTVASLKIAEGVSLQAGKDAHVTRDIFRQLLSAVWIAEGTAFFCSWILALLCTRMSLGPLKQLGELIAAVEQHPAAEQTLTLSPVPELNMLFQQIDRLAKKKSLLVVEMQASLDNLAHDLRTPMTRLRSVAEYGLQAVDDPGRLRDSLSDCLEESERVLAMLRIMMSVAEAESGTMRLELEVCDLQESLEDIVELYAYVAEEKNIELKTHLQVGLQFKGDRTRISQVWGNLVDNAIKYGREGGWLEIRSACEGSQLRVDFTDNGMGISQSEIGRIWERLYRGDRSRSQPGLGLGLNYVRAVILAHGGDVKVQSTLHQGSCFSIYLPAS